MESGTRDLGQVLGINCGSSSIKYLLLMMGQGELVAGGVVDRIGETNPFLKHRLDDPLTEVPVDKIR